MASSSRRPAPAAAPLALPSEDSVLDWQKACIVHTFERLCAGETQDASAWPAFYRLMLLRVRKQVTGQGVEEALAAFLAPLVPRIADTGELPLHMTKALALYEAGSQAAAATQAELPALLASGLNELNRALLALAPGSGAGTPGRSPAPASPDWLMAADALFFTLDDAGRGLLCPEDLLVLGLAQRPRLRRRQGAPTHPASPHLRAITAALAGACQSTGLRGAASLRSGVVSNFQFKLWLLRGGVGTDGLAALACRVEAWKAAPVKLPRPAQASAAAPAPLPGTAHVASYRPWHVGVAAADASAGQARPHPALLPWCWLQGQVAWASLSAKAPSDAAGVLCSSFTRALRREGGLTHVDTPPPQDWFLTLAHAAAGAYECLDAAAAAWHADSAVQDPLPRPPKAFLLLLAQPWAATPPPAPSKRSTPALKRSSTLRDIPSPSALEWGLPQPPPRSTSTLGRARSVANVVARLTAPAAGRRTSSQQAGDGPRTPPKRKATPVRKASLRRRRPATGSPPSSQPPRSAHGGKARGSGGRAAVAGQNVQAQGAVHGPDSAVAASGSTPVSSGGPDAPCLAPQAVDSVGPWGAEAEPHPREAAPPPASTPFRKPVPAPVVVPEGGETPPPPTPRSFELQALCAALPVATAATRQAILRQIQEHFPQQYVDVVAGGEGVAAAPAPHPLSPPSAAATPLSTAITPAMIIAQEHAQAGAASDVDSGASQTGGSLDLGGGDAPPLDVVSTASAGEAEGRHGWALRPKRVRRRGGVRGGSPTRPDALGDPPSAPAQGPHQTAPPPAVASRRAQLKAAVRAIGALRRVQGKGGE